MREKIAILIRILPFMVYFSEALLLTYYCFAVVGMELLAGQLSSAAFDNFYNTMVALFGVMMSAAWSENMYESMRVLSPLMFIYYIAFYIIVVIIILNLFLAVILDAYNVQESSQQKVKFEFKTEESKGSQEHKEVVTVSKANVKWKRELLRGDRPE